MLKKYKVGNKILIYIDSLERFYFFNKFSILKKDLVLVTNILSVYFKAKYNSYNIYLLNKVNILDIQLDYKHTLDFKAKWLNKQDIDINFNSTYKKVQKLHDKYIFTYIFIWNGERTFNLAITKFAKNKNIKILYFEISNLPKKIFIDSNGVTAKSSIAKDKVILDNYNFNEQDYQKWKERYLELKFKKNDVKQAKSVKSINFNYIVDLFGFVVLQLLKSENTSLLKKIKSKVLANSYVFKYDDYDLLKNKYLFLPLQVSTDSQILINSETDNIQAIQKASEIATSLGLDLLIKPHPAESNINYLKKLENLKQTYNFYYVNFNTFDIMNNSEVVVTINSTVGIEAMILDKKVITLGRSYYKEFNQVHLKKYIMSYLINIDYFNDEQIDIETIEQILMRAE